MTEVAPFGSWRSPISATRVAEAGVSLGQLEVADGQLYWIEGRPLEGGRQVVVGPGGDAIGAEANARTRVHEYGGGSYLVHHGEVVFSNFRDQRLWRGEVALTPEGAWRYADLRVVGDHIVCVMEDHTGPGEAVNSLVAVPLAGGPAVPLTGGHDFYSTPRPSPDGTTLAWLSWDHPNMPWDGCELWVAPIEAGPSLGDARLVAGGPAESIFQPEWSPDGVLHFVTDRTGWWNIHTEAGPVLELAAEFGRPQWVFGLSTYAFLPGGALVASFQERGVDHLGVIEAGELRRLDLPYTTVGSVRVLGDRIACLAAGPAEAPAVVLVEPGSGAVEVVHRSTADPIDPAYLSAPEPLEFPTEAGLTAHALFYPPANADFEGPNTERTPLVVHAHGGPTAAARPSLDLGIQYWTSRGVAVVDVNYGGSTGYGRAYRERLKGTWGITDVRDCINAAVDLARHGHVDGTRMTISGGSAGGYTVLCALVFHDMFSAGASYFGVADAESLARDTHKFESRYLDGLIGPYPEAAEVYRERSPIHFVDQLSCPLILFQGLEDEIVPPSQAEAMVAALREKGLPFAYLAFEGEQHGFRKAENIRRCLEAELFFYSRIFAFPLSDEIEPVAIESA